MVVKSFAGLGYALEILFFAFKLLDLMPSGLESFLPRSIEKRMIYFFKFGLSNFKPNTNIMFKGVLFFLGTILISFQGFAQSGQQIPAAVVKKIDGSVFNTSKLSNDNKPMLIDFWATWCGPCKAELNAIAQVYADWQKETGVKLVAVSIDDARNMEKVGPYVNGKNWEYEVLLDPNGDFKRAMNVNNVPHIFLVNGKGEIVWQQNSSAPGDEEKIFELVKKVANGEEIK